MSDRVVICMVVCLFPEKTENSVLMTMSLLETVDDNCFKSRNPLLKLTVLRKAISNKGSLQI